MRTRMLYEMINAMWNLVERICEKLSKKKNPPAEKSRGKIYKKRYLIEDVKRENTTNQQPNQK